MADLLDKPDYEGAVTHCVCMGIPLASLPSGQYSSVAELKSATMCGMFCGMCVPYLAKYVLTVDPNSGSIG